MLLSLYIMVISFIAYVKLPEYGFENVSVVALWIGIVFFWIANFCYDKTISDLKKEIRELKKKIEHIKE